MICLIRCGFCGYERHVEAPGNCHTPVEVPGCKRCTIYHFRKGMNVRYAAYARSTDSAQADYYLLRNEIYTIASMAIGLLKLEGFGEISFDQRLFTPPSYGIGLPLLPPLRGHDHDNATATNGGTVDILIQQVIAWGESKGIIGPLGSATAMSQAIKTLEEVNELLHATMTDNPAMVQDAIGDILVTLIMQCELNVTTLEECLECAWEQIKNRTGKMVNGVFVKD
jgi:NTP pyrophosphatase (non-canonical NTP hydrolase)